MVTFVRPSVPIFLTLELSAISYQETGMHECAALVTHHLFILSVKCTDWVPRMCRNLLKRQSHSAAITPVERAHLLLRKISPILQFSNPQPPVLLAQFTMKLSTLGLVLSLSQFCSLFWWMSKCNRSHLKTGHILRIKQFHGVNTIVSSDTLERL